jgi:exosortase E/protease (VPEID-CTERM system)
MQERQIAHQGKIFPVRVAVFVVALTAECLLAILVPHPRFGLPSYQRGVPFVFAVALLIFGGKQLSASGIEMFAVRYRFAILNVAALIAFLLIENRLAVLTHAGAPHEISILHFKVLGAIWIALLVVLALALLAVIMPLREALRVARKLGFAWMYAAICAFLTIQMRGYASSFWDTRGTALEWFFQDATFNGTKVLLRQLYPVIVQVPSARLLGTPRFVVEIKGICSGIEGLALIGTLTIAWIIFARRELRVERALLLIPLSLSVMWIMNLLRLTILIAIGDTGHRQLALNGFHSQAGWISFNLVSAAFFLIAHRVQWFRKEDSAHSLSAREPGRWRNVPAIYLGPFLAIMAASMISKATTGGFEWLYPLRFVAALVVLWAFRREYRAIDWKFGWLGPLAGAVGAGIWLAIQFHVNTTHAVPDVIAPGLASLPTAGRIAWICVRVLAAVITVPIAEELAFRGFAARRVMNVDIEAVPYERLSVLAIAVSSILFGLMHGQLWLAGIITGVIFALVAKFKGRLGEAVAAHAMSNLVIAIVVLTTHNYSLW